MKITIEPMRSLFGWSCLENSRLIWLLRRYILLRLPVNMWILMGIFWVLARASHMT